MKAISLWQPWASLIACKVKSVETRSWQTAYRGPLAIHAAKRPMDETGLALLASLPSLLLTLLFNGRKVDLAPGCLPLGAVVATATLRACGFMGSNEAEVQGFVERHKLDEIEVAAGHYGPGAVRVVLFGGAAIGAAVRDGGAPGAVGVGRGGADAAAEVSVKKPAAVSVVFEGPFVPYVRMTRRGKWVKPDALRYQASQGEMRARFKEQLIAKGHRSDAFPIFKNKQALRAHIVICVSKDLHRKDLDNQVKAILDAAAGILFENDLWIDTITAERTLSAVDLVELVVLAAKRSPGLRQATKER